MSAAGFALKVALTGVALYFAGGTAMRLWRSRFVLRLGAPLWSRVSLQAGYDDRDWIGEMNIYVGNLAFTLSEEQLRDAFGAFGEVTSAKIISDRDSGRSKGFGFVEMPNASEATAAIEKLNGETLDGRPVRVNEARPRD